MGSRRAQSSTRPHIQTANGRLGPVSLDQACLDQDFPDPDDLDQGLDSPDPDFGDPDCLVPDLVGRLDLDFLQYPCRYSLD